MICPIPSHSIAIGSKIIIRIVKMIEMDIATERSSFLHPEAAPVAIAAYVPQTDVAAERVMRSGLLVIFSTLLPNHHIKIITSGVTPHAIPRP